MYNILGWLLYHVHDVNYRLKCVSTQMYEVHSLKIEKYLILKNT